MSDDIKIAISPESWNRVVRERDEAREELRTAVQERHDFHWELQDAIRERDEAIRQRDEAREKAERYRIEANAMMMQRDEAVESIMIILEENRHLADGDDCTLAKLKSVVPDWK